MLGWKKLGLLPALAVGLGLSLSAPAAAQKTLKMQASWPASVTQYDNFTMFAKRIEQLTEGKIKIDTMPAGTIVPALEVLDATQKGVIDGAHTWSGYWVGKNKAAILFAGGPGGPWGMDHLDYLSWYWWGGGQQLHEKFLKETLKLNVVSFPILNATPQALGWFKKKIESLEDFKGQKCRQTGIVAEVYNEMGMRTVNMAGGDIMPAAERGTIDCAEWVGGYEDLQFGFHTIWKYHYAPSLHEPVSYGELLINGDTWNSLGPTNQELFKAVATETLFKWWSRWQRQNADALTEFREKHGVNVERTSDEILQEFLKAWDKVAARESERNPVFKEIYESQKAFASISVPAKQFYYPAYGLAATHYWGNK